MTRRPFYRQIRANRLRLAFFLAVFAVAALVTGYLVGLVLEPIVAPEAHARRYRYGQYAPWIPLLEGAGSPGGFPFNAVGAVAAFFLAAAAGYCGWLLKRGGGVILSLTGARRLKERQLRNTAEEMGIAAGFDRPVRVWIVEDPSLNAFACRDPGGRGAVVITRGLLGRLDRDELQAVMGHETAHLANGDTELMTLLFGVCRALDAVLWVGFFGARFLAWIARGAPGVETDEEDDAPTLTAPGLASAPPERSIGEDPEPDTLAERERVRFLRREMEERTAVGLGVLSALFVLTYVVFAVGLLIPLGLLLRANWLSVAFLVVLPLALTLLRLAISRNREHQADATAVSLCRHPAALRLALEKLRRDRTPPTRLTPSVAHLCIVPPGLRGRPGDAPGALERFLVEEGTILRPELRAAVVRHVRTLPLHKRPVAWIWARGMTGAPIARALRAARAVAALWKTHPPLEERIERVAAMTGSG